MKRFALQMNKDENEDGVTLIELLAVVVILGIIAAVAVPVVSGAIVQSKVDATETSESILQTAIERYNSDNGSYPSSLTALTQTTNGNGPYLNSIPKDGWGNPIEYVAVPGAIAPPASSGSYVASGTTASSPPTASTGYSGYVLLSSDGSTTVATSSSNASSSTMLQAPATAGSAFNYTTGGTTNYAGGVIYAAGGVDYNQKAIGSSPTLDPKWAVPSSTTGNPLVPSALQADITATTSTGSSSSPAASPTLQLLFSPN